MTALDIIRRHCPDALPDYVQSFAGGEPVLAGAGITTPLRLAHFLAQVCHESGDLTIRTESMRYSAARIRDVWPSRPEAARFAGDPAGLANCVYGGRMGNVKPSDGWRFIGRGLLQITGREDYERYGRALGVDLASNPDLAFSATWALSVAVAEWSAKSCNAYADRNDIVGLTKVINGATIGLADRRAEYDGLWPLVLGERGARFDDLWSTVAPTTPAWAVARPLAATADLQRALNRLGYARLDVDGLMGPQTKAALQQFQRSRGLTPDGIAGPKTWAALAAVKGN